MEHTSVFLPDDYDASKPLVVIAGKGNYPKLLISRARALGVNVYLIAFNGETDQDLIDDFTKDTHVVIKVGQLGKMLKYLKRFNAAYAVMAGQITPRRLFRGLYPDIKAITLLARLKVRNAETIFGTLVQEIEKIGVTQIDARVFLEDQLAKPGLMTPGRNKLPENDLHFGVNLAKEIARLGVGQGVVIHKGTVLAVEAFEGTDNMLRRAGDFDVKDALFVKTIKTGQDYRFDVPVFGMQTLDVMSEAKIRFAALESERVIILDKEAVLKQAKKRGIQIFGF